MGQTISDPSQPVKRLVTDRSVSQTNNVPADVRFDVRWNSKSDTVQFYNSRIIEMNVQVCKWSKRLAQASFEKDGDRKGFAMLTHEMYEQRIAARTQRSALDYFTTSALLGRPDPLASDSPDDVSFDLTYKMVDRLVIAAVETGARFERDSLPSDPLAWLYSPQPPFDGARPLEACLTAPGLMRCIMFHSLDLELGMPSDLVDQILRRDAGMTGETVSGGLWNTDRDRDSVGHGRTLYTATIVDVQVGQIHHVYHAMMACDLAEARGLLRLRYGRQLADQAEVRRGYDASNPLAVSMVSDAMGAILAMVASNPQSALAEGLDLQLESRFAP